MKPSLSGSIRRTVVALLLLGMGGMLHAQINDTGQIDCYDGSAATGTVSGATPNPEAAGFPRQDCTTGAAAADAVGVLYKRGDSTAPGFDYTKIANDGSELPASAALGLNPGDWACTRDNRTGLIWEVKVVNPDFHPRHANHRYTWYDTNDAVNGGNVGNVGTNESCVNSLTNCNTTAFRNRVNLARLCNATDWRLPTAKELQTLVHYGRFIPAIVTAWFPNTANDLYWSGVNYAPDASKAWGVVGDTGYLFADYKSNPHTVRMVRGGQ